MKTYDYIVIGGGSGGLLLLTAQNARSQRPFN